jgi:hypothetical protein
VLTVPFPWRKRLAYDGELLGALTRIFVSTVLGFYKARMKKEGVANGQSGAVVVVQRTSSDLKTNPHLHVLFLDGVYRDLGDEAVFRELPRLSTREVGEVLERAVKRMTRHVRRRERSGEAHDCPAGDDMKGDDVQSEDAAGLAALAASAVDGRSPPGRTRVEAQARAAAASGFPGARLRQASLREPRWVHAARGHARRGPRRARS